MGVLDFAGQISRGIMYPYCWLTFGVHLVRILARQPGSNDQIHGSVFLVFFSGQGRPIGCRFC